MCFKLMVVFWKFVPTAVCGAKQLYAILLSSVWTVDCIKYNPITRKKCCHVTFLETQEMLHIQN